MELENKLKDAGFFSFLFSFFFFLFSLFSSFLVEVGSTTRQHVCRLPPSVFVRFLLQPGRAPQEKTKNQKQE